MPATKPSNPVSPAPERRLRKLILLTSVKEIYLFFANIYGLIVHPQQTVNKIKRQKDYSQGILVFGLPVYLWLGWIVFLLFSRLFIFQAFHFGFWAKVSLLGASGGCGVLFLYLTYWVFRSKNTTSITSTTGITSKKETRENE